MLVVKRGAKFEEFNLDKIVASVPHIAKAELGGVLITYGTSLTISLTIIEDLRKQKLEVVSSRRLHNLIIEELKERGYQWKKVTLVRSLKWNGKNTSQL